MRNILFGGVLIALAGVSFASAGALPAEPGKRVHGPLAIPYGQTLTFYQKDNNVTAWFTSPPESEQETIPDFALITDRHYALGNVSIVAVFYYDLDNGGQDEVIVMYRDASGNPHLRAWGADADQMLPLTRFTPQLEKVAASLGKFNVASARQALAGLAPQQYLITDFPADLADPLFSDVLTIPGKYHAVLEGYYDELGDDVAKPQDANAYSLRFPDKFIERPNDKGEKTKYTLTLDFIRQGSCGMDELSFTPSRLYYENDTGEKEGPFVSLSLQACQLFKNTEGKYRLNKQEGEWHHYSAEEGFRLLEKGAYRHGLREGRWQAYDVPGQRQEGEYIQDLKDGIWNTYSDSGEVIAVESYHKDALSGPWLRKAAVKDVWVTEEEGQYINGRKEGAWQENMTTEPHYANYHNGLLDGELRITTLNGQNSEITHYQKGLRQGERSVWKDNGQLKKRENYRYGLLQGTRYFYDKNGKVDEMQNWSPASGANVDLCQELTSQAACDRRAASLPESLAEGEWRAFHENGQLAAISYRHNGVKVGAEYKFNHSGKLFYAARWDGKRYPVESSSYDYSQLDDLAGKPIRISLLGDTRLLKDGRQEQSTFHSGGNALSRYNFWCTTPRSGTAVCGTEYWWHRSGALSSIVQQHNNRKIESTSWDSLGFLDRQTVKTSDITFSERTFFLDSLYADTIRPAKIYYDGNEEVVTADPSRISETRRYDKQGNLVTFEEQQKRLKER